MNFPNIKTIEDVSIYVKHKPEFDACTKDNGITVICAKISDKETYNSDQARECRGICFDNLGNIVSRPLHKFFNLNENPSVLYEAIKDKPIHAIYEKLDGSFIHTVNVFGRVDFKTKSSFNSDACEIAKKFILDNQNYFDFCDIIVAMGMTAVFELTSPSNRIVLNYPKTQLTLLHVRDNITGRYVLLDERDSVWGLISAYKIPTVKKFHKTLDQVIEECKSGQNIEGYVIQFEDGDMIKIKTKWYCDRHKIISLLRERDIAELALEEKLDDVKSILRELNIPVDEVEKIEARVKDYLNCYKIEVEKVLSSDKKLSRKEFAQKYLKHDLFSLLMEAYSGKEPDYSYYYKKNKLKLDFDLKVLQEKEIEA